MSDSINVYTIYVHYYSKLLYDNHSPGVYVLPSFKSMHGEFMHLIHVYYVDIHAYVWLDLRKPISMHKYKYLKIVISIIWSIKENRCNLPWFCSYS